MASSHLRPVLLLAWLTNACVGTQNFDDGESELGRKDEEPEASPAGDAGAVPPEEPATEPAPETEPMEGDEVAAPPLVDPMLPAPDTTPANPAPSDAGATPPSPSPQATTTGDAGGDTVNPTQGSGGAAGATGMGGAAGLDAGPGCAFDACNDQGACIEREVWALCDCDASQLPACELPLFREIGPSRNNDELLLVGLSADGTTIVGSHAPVENPTQKVGVKWTLDGGLQFLAQDPEGPTVAQGVNRDGSVITGVVEPSAGGDPISVIWRDGVLSRATDADGSTEMDDFGGTRPPRPSVEEVLALLSDAGIGMGSWDIMNVNAISEDGKVIFGFGLLPDHGARWLLRLP